MASSDWTYLNDGLDIATVDRGVTAGIPRPPGGGSFLFGFNSLTAAKGAVALFANLVNFAPMAKGGRSAGACSAGPAVDRRASHPSSFSAARARRSTTRRICSVSRTTIHTASCCGRLGMEFTNSDTASHSIGNGGSVTFRNRFPASPSSITFSSLNQSAGFSGNPSSYFPDRDGFGFYSYQTVPALGTVWWYGTYTAIA